MQSQPLIIGREILILALLDHHIVTEKNRKSRRFLSTVSAAFVVRHRSFPIFEHQSVQQSVKQMHGDAANRPLEPTRPTHFLPASSRLTGLKFRELVEGLDTAWGISEIWWQVLHTRVRREVTASREASAANRIDGSSSYLLGVSSAADRIEWSDWLPKDWSVHLAVDCDRSALRSSAAVKDAVAQVLLSHGIKVTKAEQDPSDDPQHPPLSIKVSLFRDTLSVYLPLGLEPWHKRCYKTVLRDLTGGHLASLREDYAQGVIAGLAQWLNIHLTDLPQRLFVPFAGSGTFCFEYITLVWQLGHSIVGCSAAISTSPGAPQRTLANLRKKSLEQINKNSQAKRLRFWSCDTNPQCLALQDDFSAEFLGLLPEGAQTSIDWARTGDDFYRIQKEQLLEKLEIPDHKPQIDHSICLLLNPPFGERLERNDAKKDYQRIASIVAIWSKNIPIVGALICPNDSLAIAFTAGLGPGFTSKTVQFSYGKLDGRIVYFAAN
jgi:23S rRNA G2445 N2-methylase RlmL